MYNLIEYSDKCSDSSGNLWGFKRDDIVNNADVATDDDAPSLKACVRYFLKFHYTSDLIT